MILTIALVLTLIPVVAPVGTVSADTDSLITALVLNETEATALGLEFQSIDDTSSVAGYVTAKYVDHSPADYSIFFTVTLSPHRGSPSDAPNIVFEDETYGCSNCLDPDCQQYEVPGGQLIPRRPCYSPYMNGYTDFGLLAGETVFAQGDLLVKIESSTGYGITTAEYHELSKSRHEWFVEQVVAKITAGYLADVMQLTAYAYVATQPLNQGLAYEGQDVVFLEGTVTGPNGGVAGARLEGFYHSEAGSGWNYALTTDSSGNFKRVMGLATEVHSISVKVNHTETSPAYAGTDTIWIRDFNGQPAETDTGMSLTVSTDKKAYSAGETAVIQGAVSDDSGPVIGASVTVNVSGTQLSATTDSSGNYRVEFPIPPDVTQAVYTVSATASHNGKTGTSPSVTFSVGGIVVTITTDKDHYLIGDTVYSTITVKDSQGTPVPGAELRITTTRSDSGRTTELSGFTDTLGENQWNFTWGQDDSGKTIAEGKLKIDITAAKDGANGQASITICGCGDLEKTKVEDCLDCPEDSPCEPEEVCDPSSDYRNPDTMCSPKVAYVFISNGLGWYHEWWASDDIAGIRKLYASLGYTVPPSIHVDHINDIAPYLSRPSTMAFAYAGHGEEPGGTPTLEVAAATSGVCSVKATIAMTGKWDKGFLGVCQFGPYASKWVDSKDKLEKILADRVAHPNLDYVYMFSCYSLDDMSMRDYLLRSGGTYWGYKGKLPGNATLTKTYKP